MEKEPIAAWFVPINRGDEVALLIKMPAVSLKHIARGVQVRFSLAVIEMGEHPLLATALTVYDDPQSPILVCGADRHEEEHRAMVQALESGAVSTIFFDELSRPMAWAMCQFDSEEVAPMLDKVRSGGKLYTGPFTERIGQLLDRFEGTLDPEYAMPGHVDAEVLHAGVTSGPIKDIQIHAIGQNEVGQTSLLEANEGQGLEQATWQLLEGLYQQYLHRSPKVGTTEKDRRELTDVLAMHPLGTLLVEAKAAAVFAVSRDCTTARRVANIQKQIDKGIEQLKGAVKRLRSGHRLWSSKDKSIVCPFGAEVQAHGIVMVSEMHPRLEWELIRTRLLAVAKEVRVPLHVIDLRELRLLVGVATSPAGLGENLRRRFEAMVAAPSAYLRGRVPPPI